MTKATSVPVPGLSAAEHDVMRDAAARFLTARGMPGEGPAFTAIRALTQPGQVPAAEASRDSYWKNQATGGHWMNP